MYLNISEVFNQVFYENADVRTRDWFLMGTPFKLMLFYSTYLVMTKLINDIAEKKKRKYNMKNNFVLLYCVLTLTTWYLMYKVVKYMIWSHQHYFFCIPVDHSLDEKTMEVSRQT